MSLLRKRRRAGNESAPIWKPGGVQLTRPARIWLLVFLVLTCVFTAGTLAVRNRFGGLQAYIIQAVEAQAGVDFQVEGVSLAGIHCVALDRPAITMEQASGTTLSFDAPRTYVYIDLLSILQGKLLIERVDIEGGRLQVEHVATAPWFEYGGSPEVSLPFSAPNSPVHLSGTGCELLVTEQATGRSMSVADIAFSVAPAESSETLELHGSGKLRGDPEKALAIDGTYSNRDDFSVTFNADRITAQDVNSFLATPQHVVHSGTANIHLVINGYPDKPASLSATIGFGGVGVDSAFAFLAPESGTINAQATYDTEEELLRITTARADTPGLLGELSGNIRLGDPVPLLDIRLEADRLPVQPLVEHALQGRLTEYGELDAQVSQVGSLELNLSGPIDDPEVTARGELERGTLRFEPNDDRVPRFELDFEQLHAEWDSVAESLEGRLTVVDGAITHPFSGIDATDLTASIVFKDNALRLESATAMIAGSRIAGSGTYDVAGRAGSLAVNGTLQRLEDTVLATSIRNIELQGAASVDLQAELTEGAIKAHGSVDATQAAVRYRWWFLKPVGIGVRADISCDFVPGESLSWNAALDAAATALKADGHLRMQNGRLALQEVHAEIQSLDLTSLGKCLDLPYAITGGTVSGGGYTWDRLPGTGPDGSANWHANLACQADAISIRLLDAQHALEATDVTLEADYVNSAENTGIITLGAASSHTPPLGEPWFAPLEIPPELRDKYEPDPRDYTFCLTSAAVEVPPWKGTDFKGIAYVDQARIGLKEYSATIGEGHIAGDYAKDRAENAYQTSAEWDNVPVSFFLNHMSWPSVLSGLTTGRVAYSLDCDDPSTLHGEGQFGIYDGKFSADFILNELQKQMEGPTALPPSLQFSELRADVLFEKDNIQTPSLSLTSEGIRMDASGHFVTGGEMDYDLKVSISPETAEKMPVLRENLNLEGHRLANQNVELAFKIAGPAFRPRGELAQGQPVSVTLVTGGLEMVSEAVKVIDIPRKILVDLLKIGGGIMGASKVPEQN